MTKDIKKYDEKILLDMLKQMMAIRRFEERAAKAYGLRKIGGFCHLYIGQEAVAVGSVSAVDLKKDYVITAYRDHGHALAVGMNPNVVMAELFGKITGCSRGKGGSMHMFDRDKHFYGGHGIVGAHIPLAAGMAMKIKYHEENGVVLCFFGDGAIHQGSFHEALNIASVLKLPAVYICENNKYGMGTDFKRVSAEPELYKLGGSYQMEGRSVDGMNVLEIYDNVKEVAGKVRESGKPALIEMRTYRYQGHSMSDPATYRTKDELAGYKKQDPIIIFKDKLIEAALLDEDKFNQLDDQAKDMAKQAEQYAQQSDKPALETRFEDVLCP